MSKPTIPNGTLIDNRYLIQRLLGQGGLGRTYLAFDTRRFNEACVLKEFAPSGTGKYSLQKSRALFKREAEILYHVQHPQIPDFLACFEGDERLFLVQEFVNGKTYSDLLKERRKQNKCFSEQEVIHWLNNLLPVLEYIHQCGVIHRDISPDNIMLPDNSQLPVLIDFGVGKQIVEASQLTNNGEGAEEVSYVGKMSLVGKVGYAPHEQIRLGVCSPSSDLYALGVTAVVLLTCQDPSMLMNQYSLQWEWRDRVQVSQSFGNILDQMLADTPAKRYQTATEVSQDLAILNNQTSSLPSLPETLNLVPTAISPEHSRAPNNQALNQQSPSPQPPSPQPPDTQAFASPPPVGQMPANPPVAPPTVADMPPTSWPSSPVAGAPPASTISSEFVERCKVKLSDYLGPMAAMIVDEAISGHRPDSPERLVDLLAPEIPSSEEASDFRRQLLG